MSDLPLEDCVSDRLRGGLFPLTEDGCSAPADDQITRPTSPPALREKSRDAMQPWRVPFCGEQESLIRKPFVNGWHWIEKSNRASLSANLFNLHGRGRRSISSPHGVPLSRIKPMKTATSRLQRALHCPVRCLSSPTSSWSENCGERQINISRSVSLRRQLFSTVLTQLCQFQSNTFLRS
jgi:hypothetical protein